MSSQNQFSVFMLPFCVISYISHMGSLGAILASQANTHNIKSGLNERTNSSKGFG